MENTLEFSIFHHQITFEMENLKMQKQKQNKTSPQRYY